MWPWEKKKTEKWWRNGSRPFPWKEDDYFLAERAYESYTTAFYAANKFATTTHISFKDLPIAAKEVWRKTADDVARAAIMFDSGRQDYDDDEE